MSLIGALNIGQSALSAQQAAIQVTGNNIANAGNPDYVRETASFVERPAQEIKPGIFVGTGVDLSAITRQVDDALDGRLRSATSDNAGATATQQLLSQVEAAINATGDKNLQTTLTAFYSSWSTLADKPQDAGQRQVVIQAGQNVADELTSLRSQLTAIQTDAGASLKGSVSAADGLASQIASLNGQVVVAEGGTGGTANALRDQRDADLAQLSKLMDVRTLQQSNGTVDVYAGSEALVTGTTSNGLSIRQDTRDGRLVNTVVFKSNNGVVPVTSGQLGATTSASAEIDGVVNQLDTISHNVIFEVNKLHASGQGLDGISSVTGTNAVSDATAVLGSAAAGLSFQPTNGSFVVHVTQKATGAVTSTLVQVDPNTTSLKSLAAQLDAIDGVQASVSNGKLQVAAENTSVDLGFSQDSSGTLAALGVNTFFTGTDASNIAVNSTVVNDSSLLAAAKNGDKGDNQTALAIAALDTTPVAALGGASIGDTYQKLVNELAGKVSAASDNAQATQSVQDALTAQQQATSGVSLDEEAVNLIQQQRAYQGAARYISTVNEMLQSLLSITT